jgi:hypothetical protein
MCGDFGELDYLPVSFGHVWLRVGIRPFDGVVMKVSNVIADQQVFTGYVEASEEPRWSEADDGFESKTGDGARLLHLKSGPPFFGRAHQGDEATLSPHCENGLSSFFGRE